ncbi:MAG: sigma-54-dependent Fis family transcriptional regulator [Bacteroidales bacterium]|jgi:transcriptional regulator with PAS, ATPase and Fis domain|nr:sigma-54 dependent transcriptional regulator [Bacteroidota bacterium]NLN99347.1 sigma-54-dependent Fis family transcriptional regulator [Bacteroidales bacterium]
MDSQDLQRLKNKYDIIGNNAALNRALETAVAVAPTDLTVLVTGESGVGKENIPKIIHHNSLRKNSKYFAVNCGAIPQGTIDSELFGHEKGSFTGAIETRKGYFEEANGGTLFLDEVGELPLASQAKLLRVLQSGEYIKVGSSKVEKTDVRVIAATNSNLFYAVGKGKFREDLYYRLNAIQILMPALRDRKEDIYLFFRKFTSDFSEKYGMGKVTLTNEAIDLLINYRWPGNIRQLKNLAETVTALESERLTPTSERCVVDADTLGKYMPKDESALLPVVAKEMRGDPLPDSERQMIIKAILDLKQEVDNLKARMETWVPPVPALKPADEPDWQGPGAPVPSVEVGKILDIHKEEPRTLSLQKISKEVIMKALEMHDGNRKLAAKEVGISERTLYRWIDKYRLSDKPEKKN